jgi:hypothetical protein
MYCVEVDRVVYGTSVSRHLNGPEPTGRRRRRRHLSAQRVQLILAIVVRNFGIDKDAFYGPSRGHAKVSLARQVAMYLAHVICSVDHTEIGRVFGRDRTTVRHACHSIEDRRDDPRFDHMIELTVAIFWRLHDLAFAPDSAQRPCWGAV